MVRVVLVDLNKAFDINHVELKLESYEVSDAELSWFHGV